MLEEADRRAHITDTNISVTHTAQEERLYRRYKELLRWVPSIREASSTDLRNIVQQLGQGADSARSDDTHLLKVEVVNWLMSSLPKPDPPPLKG
ncbi:hypothetical protein HD554DRAFT_2172858 [Boletus coccyginus]|nr:hypothetical protein HD554DRAFT_2172858 [Boletus coccyginus]